MSSNESIPVIAAMSIYNEVDAIEQALESCKSLGIISIHILDGAMLGRRKPPCLDAKKLKVGIVA